MRHHHPVHHNRHLHRLHHPHGAASAASPQRYRSQWLVAAALIAALLLFGSVWLQEAPPAAQHSAPATSVPDTESHLTPME